PAQKSPPPPGVQKVTVVFCPLPAGVEEVPHAASQAVPPPQPSQRRNARRSSVYQLTPWFLRLMTCRRPSDVQPSYKRGFRRELCIAPASLTQQTAAPIHFVLNAIVAQGHPPDGRIDSEHGLA